MTPPQGPRSALTTSIDPPAVEAKVKTASVTAAVVALVLSLLSAYVFRGGAVPDALAVSVTAVLSTVVGGVVTFVVGWLTRHTPRALLEVTEDRTR